MPVVEACWPLIECLACAASCQSELGKDPLPFRNEKIGDLQGVRVLSAACARDRYSFPMGERLPGR